MVTKEEVGFTSEDFYNRYIRNQINAGRPAEVGQQYVTQQTTYQTAGEYNVGAPFDSNSQYGNFTTALNAPRMAAGEFQGGTYTVTTANQAGNSGGVTSANEYQLGRAYSIQGAAQQQQYVNTQPGYSGVQTQQTTQVANGSPQRESHITRIKAPLSIQSQMAAGQNRQQSSQVVPGSTTIRTSQVKQGEVIKGQSRIEYIPFQNTIIDYETRQWIEKVPVQKKVIEYEEKRTLEQVPREVTKTDYYAVEYVKEYIPEVVQQRVIEMVPVEKVINKTQYIPIQTQIIHNPDGTKVQGQSRILYQPQNNLPAGMIQGQSGIRYQTEASVSAPIVQGQSRLVVQPAQMIVPQQVKGQSRIVYQQQPVYQQQVFQPQVQQVQQIQQVQQVQQVGLPTEQIFLSQQPAVGQQVFTQVDAAGLSNYYGIPLTQTTNVQQMDSRITGSVPINTVSTPYVIDNSQSQMILAQTPEGQQILIPVIQQPIIGYPQQQIVYQQVAGTPQVYMQPQELRQSVRVVQQPQQIYGVYPEQQQIIYQQQPQYVQQQYITEPQQIYTGQQFIQQGQVIQSAGGPNARYSAQVDKYIQNMERQYRR